MSQELGWLDLYPNPNPKNYFPVLKLSEAVLMIFIKIKKDKIDKNEQESLTLSRRTLSIKGTLA